MIKHGGETSPWGEYIDLYTQVSEQEQFVKLAGDNLKLAKEGLRELFMTVHRTIEPDTGLERMSDLGGTLPLGIDDPLLDFIGLPADLGTEPQKK